MKQLTGTCKDCGIEISIAEYAVELEEKRGNSRPERCQECRQVHAMEINSLGSSHFFLKHNDGIGETLGNFYLGEIDHGTRLWKKGEYKLSERKYQLMRKRIGMRDEVEVKDLYEKLNNNQVIVAVAPTGTGKSTYLPYVLLEPINQHSEKAKSLLINGSPTPYRRDHFTANGPILVSQPRVGAAVKIAEAVAENLYGTPIGPGYLIGYKIGRQKTKSKNKKDENLYDRFTKLIYITDGSLVNWVLSGNIHEYSVIIIDEAHERNVNIDIILMLLRNELIKYPHLKLIITSATIDPEEFKRYYSGVTSVAVCDFSDAREEFLYECHFNKKDSLRLDQVVTKTAFRVAEVFNAPNKLDNGKLALGHVIAFLPGKNEILQCEARLKKILKNQKVKVVPLYRGAPDENIKDTTNNNDGVRRIYLATNIAETSLTINNLDYVVESGLIKVNRWNPKIRRNRLDLEWHSKAGCRQRWGRVGRGRKGWVYTMYNETQFNQMSDYTPIGVLKENLEEVLLRLSIAGFSNLEDSSLWLQKPKMAELERCKHLFNKRDLIEPIGEGRQLISKYGEQVYKVSQRINMVMSEVEMDLAQHSLDIACFLMLCERFGCLTEGATVVSMFPLLGNSLYQRIEIFEDDDQQGKGMLLWDEKWSQEQKAAVFTRHKLLKSNCRDDLEFVLKLFGMFEGNPTLLDLPSDWRSYFFIDESVFLSEDNQFPGVKKIRDTLLITFQEGASDLSRQFLNYNKVGLVRLLMNIAWPDKAIKSCDNGFVVRESDGVIGVVNKFSVFNPEHNINGIAAYYERSERLISEIVVEESQEDSSTKQKPNWGYDVSFVVLKGEASLPSQHDTLNILEYYNNHKNEHWLLAPEFSFVDIELEFNQLTTTDSKIRLMVVDTVFDVFSYAGVCALIGEDSLGNKHIVDYNEAYALNSGSIGVRSKELPINVTKVALDSGSFTLTMLIELYARVEAVDTTKRYSGKVVDIFQGREKIFILLDIVIFENEHPFTFSCPITALSHNMEVLQVGSEVSLKLTKSNRSWLYIIGEDQEYFREVANENKQELREMGFLWVYDEKNNFCYLTRYTPITHSELMFIAKQDGDYKSLLLSYLAQCGNISINYQTVETKGTLANKNKLIKEVLKSDDIPEELNSLLKNNSGQLSRSSVEFLWSTKEKIRSAVFDADKKNRRSVSAEKRLISCQEYIRKIQNNINKNRNELANDWSESHKTRRMTWIIDDEAKLAAQRQKELELLVEIRSWIDTKKLAKDLLRKEIKNENFDSLRYIQDYYLQRESGDYISCIEDSLLAIPMYQKYSVVKVKKVINRNQRFMTDWCGEIKTGDEMYLTFLKSSYTITKSKDTVIDEKELRNLKADVIDKLVLFRASSVKRNYVILEPLSDVDTVLQGNLKLVLSI